MKRAWKWILALMSVPVVAAAGGASYLYAAFPKAGPAPQLHVSATPEQLERGRYLAEHVTLCVGCHADRDFARFGGPIKPGTAGQGGEHFSREMGFPGDIYAANITPRSLGSWSDGELARAITTGVSRDGRALFPLMPYGYYRHLCDRDLQAIIGYVRTLPSSGNVPPKTELDFPVSLIVRTAPAAAEPWACPSPGSAEYGKYLTTISVCQECHTKQERGKTVGEPFAGGFRFPLPSGGFAYSQNITPDPETGIGKWSREQFIALFKSRAAESAAFSVKPGKRQTMMPWSSFGGMTETDLGAIYDYLRTVAPVKNRIETFEAAN